MHRGGGEEEAKRDKRYTNFFSAIAVSEMAYSYCIFRYDLLLFLLLKRTYQDVWINKYCFSRFKSDKIQTVDYLYYMYLALNIEVCNYHRTDLSYITIHIQYYRYYSYYSKRRVQHFLTCKATLFSGFFKHFESQCNTYCLEIKNNCISWPFSLFVFHL